MKNLGMILGVLILSFSTNAQEKTSVKQSDLKGPAYKNFQHWSHQAEPAKIYSKNNGETLQGPDFKNQPAWKTNSKKDLVEVQFVGDKKQALTGPAYKNYGPWSE